MLEPGPRAGDALGPLERLLLLKRTPLLAALADDATAALAEATRERYVPAGRELLREDEPPASLHFVASGEVALSWRGVPLGRVGSWGPVAGLHAFLQGEAGLGARTVRDTLTLEIGAEAFTDLVEDHFALAHTLVQHLASDLLELSRQHGCPSLIAGDGQPLPLLSPVRGLDLVERVLVLKEVALFSRASLTTLAHLGRGLDEVALPPGTILWDREDGSDDFVLVVEGLVRCETAPGQAFVLRPGGAPGILEALAAQPHRARAVTVGHVRALRGRGEAVIDALEDDADLAFQVMAVLARDTLALVAATAGGPEALGRLMGCSTA